MLSDNTEPDSLISGEVVWIGGTSNSKKKYYTYKYLRIQAQRQCIERTKGTTNCSDVLSKIVKLTETILIKSLRIMLLHGKSAYNFGI